MNEQDERTFSQFLFGEPQSVLNEKFQDAFVELNSMIGALVCLCLSKGVFTADDFHKLRVRTAAGIDQVMAQQQEDAQKEFLEKIKNDPVAKKFLEVFGNPFEDQELTDEPIESDEPIEPIESDEPIEPIESDEPTES